LNLDTLKRLDELASRVLRLELAKSPCNPNAGGCQRAFGLLDRRERVGKRRTN
jgi:hypothetical protein